jgi:hypothetical protein
MIPDTLDHVTQGELQRYENNYKTLNLKDRRRRPEGVNGSQLKFLTEFGLCPKINPKPLSSNPIKTV